MVFFLVACVATGDASAGAGVYTQACESCHGEDGTADVLVDDTPSADLTTAVPALDDTELQDVIVDGTGAMPAVTVDDTQLVDLMAYLREVFP